MRAFLTDSNFPVTVLQPDADRYDSNPASSCVNLKNYEGVTFLLAEGAGGTGTVKIQVEECTAAAGTGNTAIPFTYQVQSTLGTIGAVTAASSGSTGYTTTAGASKMILVHVRAESLDVGYPFVRLKLTEVVNDPCDAGVIAVLWGPRYASDNLPDPLV